MRELVTEGELFSVKGLQVPSLTDEEIMQRIEAYGGIMDEIDANLGLGRAYTQVEELRSEKARLAADRTILSRQLSSVALLDEVEFAGPHRLF